MENAIALSQTPEEQELENKLAELAALETSLAGRELDLATHLAQLHAFERKYLQIVGSRYTEINRLEAQIAEYMAYLESIQCLSIFSIKNPASDSERGFTGGEVFSLPCRE